MVLNIRTTFVFPSSKVIQILIVKYKLCIINPFQNLCKYMYVVVMYLALQGLYL